VSLTGDWLAFQIYTRDGGRRLAGRIKPTTLRWTVVTTGVINSIILCAGGCLARPGPDVKHRQKDDLQN